MRKTLTLLITAATFKVTPLLQSFIIIYFAGAAYYADFGYYLIVAMFTSAILSTGVVPAYIRMIGREVSGPVSAIDLSRFVILAIVFIILVFLIVIYLGLFSQGNGFVALVLGLSLGINTSLMPILIVTGEIKVVLLSNLLFLVLSSTIATFSGWVPKHLFQLLFLASPCFLSILFIVQFWRSNKSELLKNANRSFLYSISVAAKEIAPVFVPNVFWMGMLFLFSHRVSILVATPDIFSWYAVGLQIFGIFVFIPNSVAPLFLLKMSDTTSKESKRFGYLLTFTIISVGMIIYLMLWALIVKTPVFQIDNSALHIWMFISGAGVLAAGVAPLNSFLVREGKAYLIGIGAIIWAVVAHVGLVLVPYPFEMVFLTAYFCAYLTLIGTVYLVN